MIKASSGLSDDEIEKMVKDAEAHADEDRKVRELVETRNQADAMIHATEKSLKDLGDQVEASDKEAIESAIEDLKKSLEGSDKADIEAKTQALAEASGKLAEKAYAASSGDAGTESAQASDANANSSDDVVDAEFEEVKDDEKK